MVGFWFVHHGMSVTRKMMSRYFPIGCLFISEMSTWRFRILGKWIVTRVITPISGLYVP